MVSLLAAFQFLTILPGIIRRPFTPREIGGAVGWYPLVGLALGGVLYGLNAALHWIFPAALVAALTLTAWVVVTRALHLDGFMDTCDGLFGGFTPESRLEIMRDSRTGAFGAIGGMLLLLTKFAALISLPNLLPALLLAPMLARAGLTLAIFGFPYARQKGLGRDIKDHASWREIALASAISLAAAWLDRSLDRSRSPGSHRFIYLPWITVYPPPHPRPHRGLLWSILRTNRNSNIAILIHFIDSV